MQRVSDGKQVHVLAHRGLNIFEAVFNGAWATHMYTFATYEGIYCLYPEITLQRRQSVLFRPVVARPGESGVSKCVRRGLSFVRSDSVVDLDEWQQRRSSVDDYTLRIGFSRTPDVQDCFKCLLIEVAGESVKMISRG